MMEESGGRMEGKRRQGAGMDDCPPFLSMYAPVDDVVVSEGRKKSRCPAKSQHPGRTSNLQNLAALRYHNCHSLKCCGYL